jgi:hypothetical protein
MRFTMLRKTTPLLLACLALGACASEGPHVVQASTSAPEVHLTNGMATQIEVPEGSHVQSVVVGSPNLVSAERADNVVNLVPKGGTGQTNLIIRAYDEDRRSQVYQYRVIVD